MPADLDARARLHHFFRRARGLLDGERWLRARFVILPMLVVCSPAPPGLADGKVFSPVAFPANVTIPDQRALIHFTNGVERLVIETRFEGAGTNFAWVVPLPATPLIEEATTGLFPTLDHLFRPKILHDVTRYYLGILMAVGLVGLLGYVACSLISFLVAFGTAGSSSPPRSIESRRTRRPAPYTRCPSPSLPPDRSIPCGCSGVKVVQGHGGIGWANLLLGGSIREEDSPGNFTLRDQDDKLEFLGLLTKTEGRRIQRLC